MVVIKRDGTQEEFQVDKVESAVLKAFAEVDGEETQYAKRKSKEIASFIESLNQGSISVDDIQDVVEEKLMNCSRKDVARAYINYRYLHDMARQQYKDMMDVVAEKLMAKNVQNQNANVDEYSFGGRIGEASNAVMKKYALDFCMSDMARKNHEENMIYIHDLDHYSVGCHNCLSIPFDDLLANGFNTRQTDIRPANSVNTAFQLVAVIFEIQSLQEFGGVSATHLDWTMVPYVRKSFFKHFKDGLKYISNCDGDTVDALVFDESISINDESYMFNLASYNYAMDMTKKEIHQAVEGMYHNLNTMQSRAGNQLPFTSINYGTCTSIEGRMVTKELLEVSIEGIGKLHRTSIFPCGIFQYMKGVNDKPGTPNYDLYQLALKSTSRRLYPNYANVDWSGNAGYDRTDPRTYFSTMGERKLQLM